MDGGGVLPFEENYRNISEVRREVNIPISVSIFWGIFLPCQIILPECAVHSAHAIVNPTNSPLKADFLS